MKRRLFVIMTALTLSTATFAGCGNTQATSAISEPTEAPVTEEVTPTEPVEEPTEEPTEQPTQQAEEPTAEPTEQPTEKPTEPVQEPTQPVETEPQFTYSDLSATMYAKSSVNVRNQPNADGEKLGGLSRAQEVAVTGQCNETSWYRISYNGGEAYVSDKYLVNEKPAEEVAQQPVEEAPASNELPSCPYPLYTLIDNGDSIVFYYEYYSSNGDMQEVKSSLADQAFYTMMERKSEGQGTGNSLAFVGEYKEGEVYSITTSNYYY